jgi:hypothetical protein
MAVEDKYTDTNLAAGKISNAFVGQGQKVITLVGTEETAAADDDGSIYRFFKSVPSSYIPVQIDIMTDGITGGTDFELGLYEVGTGGAAVDIDVLMGTQDLSSALTRATGQGLGLAAVDIASVGSTLGTLSAQTNVDAAYDIALTANTVGSGVGTISIIATFMQG